MSKVKRILALLGVVLLVAMYGSTLVFALMDHPQAKGLLMASIYCTIAVPVLLYAISLVTRLLKEKNRTLHQKDFGTKPKEKEGGNVND